MVKLRKVSLSDAVVWHVMVHRARLVSSNQPTNPTIFSIVINQKFGRNLSLWQSDINITSSIQADAMDQIFSQIENSKTTALVYLTVYPILGFGNVTDAAIAAFAGKIQALTAKGTKLFIRYASEMNGAWFPYGQQPSAFKASWIKLVSAVRKAAGASNVAFIWAPNSANGYPYKKSPFSVVPGDAKWDPSLDTNGDGLYDLLDDPFTPFYPGDEWVDWVGMSVSDVTTTLKNH